MTFQGKYFSRHILLTDQISLFNFFKKKQRDKQFITGLQKYLPEAFSKAT